MKQVENLIRKGEWEYEDEKTDYMCGGRSDDGRNASDQRMGSSVELPI